jgi:transposase
MERFVLTDAQWAKMEPHCLGKPGDPGRSGKNNRLFVEAVLWRTGSPWRDLPAAFGHWNSVTRFRDWAKADVQKRLIGAVSDDPDMEYAMVGSYHRQGAAATVRRAKGDSNPSDWPLERRHDHQNPCAHRCARQSRLRGADRSPVHLFSCRSCAQLFHRLAATDRRQSTNVTRDVSLSPLCHRLDRSMGGAPGHVEVLEERRGGFHDRVSDAIDALSLRGHHTG